MSYINVLVWNLEKGTDEPIAGQEMQMQRTDLWAQQAKEKVGQIERVALIYSCYHL